MEKDMSSSSLLPSHLLRPFEPQLILLNISNQDFKEKRPASRGEVHVGILGPTDVGTTDFEPSHISWRRRAASPVGDFDSGMREPAPGEMDISNKRVRLSGSPDHTLSLTQDERRLFELLIAVVARFNSNTTLRVAGGWVRDKLLGRPNDDIDIALDNLSGERFAALVNQLLEERGEAVSSIGVIQANPDQSKHLETATVKVYGMDIDFVNLRSETYSDSSRIPQIQFGTPGQDAERRDFTCNALFYNIHSEQVEDWCGTGLQDLHAGVLRTPLAPELTLMDDPLRVLRAVRFSARLSFELEPSLRNAASSPSVQLALLEKVARERVGKELDGMLGAAEEAPLTAIRLLLELGLGAVVFKVPASATPGTGVGSAAYLGRVALVMGESWPHGPLIIGEHRRLMLLAGCCAQWRDSSVTLKKKQVATVLLLVRDSLKMRVKDAENLVLLLSKARELISLSKQLSTCARSSLGLYVRCLKGLWRTGVRLACAVELAEAESADCAEVLGRLGGLERAVDEWGLDKCWEVTGLMDGKALMERLKLPKGPQVGVVLQEQTRWQLDHPEGTREQCEQYLVGWWADRGAAKGECAR